MNFFDALTLVFAIYAFIAALAVEADGISNIAAVIVPMFAFLNGPMVTSTRRYLSMESAKVESFVDETALCQEIRIINQ